MYLIIPTRICAFGSPALCTTLCNEKLSRLLVCGDALVRYSMIMSLLAALSSTLYCRGQAGKI